MSESEEKSHTIIIYYIIVIRSQRWQSQRRNSQGHVVGTAGVNSSFVLPSLLSVQSAVVMSRAMLSVRTVATTKVKKFTR